MPGVVRCGLPPCPDPNAPHYVFASHAAAMRFAVIVAVIGLVLAWWFMQVQHERMESDGD